MKRLATFTAQGRQLWGAVADTGLVALSDSFLECRTLRSVIAADAWKIVSNAAKNLAVTHPFGSFQWDIPVPDPEKIICVGVNFPDRNAEYKDGQDAPQNMSLFPRFPNSFVGHEQPLTRPPESAQLDYEGEIAVVIGKGGRRIPEGQASDQIAALTLCNEGTIRDWVRHAKFNVTQGKNWDGSGAMDPWLVPFTNPAQVTDIALETRVNAEIRQSDRTGRMLFPVARRIAYISTFTTLVPGDIIVTGTLTGAGARLDPPKWLLPGDLVEGSATGIGPFETECATNDPRRDLRLRRDTFHRRTDQQTMLPDLCRSSQGHTRRRLCHSIRAGGEKAGGGAKGIRLENRPHVPCDAKRAGHHHPRFRCAAG